MIRWLKKHFFPHRGNHHHPHILRHKSLAAVLTLVVFLEFVMFLGPVVLSRFSSQLAAVLPSVVTLLTNDARAKGQLAEVKMNEVLTLAAQAKAEDMATKGYFAHVSPDGSVPWHWLDEAGYKYQYAGENLAVNFSDSEELVKAWQNSPTHNLNLLGPRYTETGVGVATGMYQGREAVFVVQFFAAPQKKEQVAIAKPPVPVSEEVAPAPNPVNQKVLAAETQAQSAPYLWSRIISSPRTYGTYALLVLALLFILVLVIGLGRHHPKAFAGGVVVVMILAGVIYMNKHVMFPKLMILGQESATEKINARILPTLWFSSLTPKEGENVKIYAVIQNNSGKNFSGEIIFYADNLEIKKFPFSSSSDVLKEISVVWRAAVGKHTFRAAISTDLASGAKLVSYESSEAILDISRPEVPLTLNDVEVGVSQTISAVTNKVDELASTLADKLESAKKPDASSALGEAAVLGTTTNTGNSVIPASVYNTGVGVASILVRNWMWTLSGLAVLGLFWAFRS